MKFPLPKGWVWARCHDVIDVRDGTHDTPKKVDCGIPMVTSKNLKPYGIDFDDVTYISEEDYESIEKRSGVDDGDILFAMIGTIGNPVLVKKDRPFSIKNVALFKIDEMKMHAPFFKFMLDSPVITRQLDANSRGGNQKFVSLSSLRNMQIPLPPLPEQKRIAAILDKADSIRRKRQEAVRLTEELLRSVYFDMFGGLTSIKQNIKHIPLKDLCSRITYGFTCPMSHLDTGIPILTAKNVLHRKLDLENVHYASQNEFDALTDKSKPEFGDILITKDGTIGRCAVVNTKEPICINQSVALIKPNTALVLPEYLEGFINSFDVQNRIQNMGKGNAIQHLQITELAIFPVPLPTIDEQEKYLKVRNTCLSTENLLRESQLNAEAVFGSLLQRAFKGDVENIRIH